ncbi:hypothetical protein BSPWISOXPB_9717 [uncultured Gammaproteobacteria bacterium]|nr:hypothetical protein BSPWISOXPB_9717 [uncultured Gammaproteobacteria bacterium]
MYQGIFGLFCKHNWIFIKDWAWYKEMQLSYYKRIRKKILWVLFFFWAFTLSNQVYLWVQIFYAMKMDKWRITIFWWNNYGFIFNRS